MQGQDQVTLGREGKSQQTFTLLASVGDGPNQVQAISTRVLPIVTATPTPTPDADLDADADRHPDADPDAVGPIV